VNQRASNHGAPFPLLRMRQPGVDLPRHVRAKVSPSLIRSTDDPDPRVKSSSREPRGMDASFLIARAALPGLMTLDFGDGRRETGDGCHHAPVSRRRAPYAYLPVGQIHRQSSFPSHQLHGCAMHVPFTALSLSLSLSNFSIYPHMSS
jgi:hypothetical protein